MDIINFIKLLDPSSIKRKLNLIWYRVGVEKEPYPQEKSVLIAQKFITNKIPFAKSFTNVTGRKYILAFSDYQWHLLKKISKTFILEKEGSCFGHVTENDVKVTDLDYDGLHEISFSTYSGGTGAGAHILTVLLTEDFKCFEIESSSNWQDFSGPSTWQLKFTPKPDEDEERIIEKLLDYHRFTVNEEDVKPNDPKHAVTYWFRDNLISENSTIQLRYFEGFPLEVGSVIDEIETPNFIYISYFKEALKAYNKITDKFFVIYSPAWMYNWIDQMVYVNDRLYFCERDSAVLICFQIVSEKEGSLLMFNRHRGLPLEPIRKIETKNGILLLNGCAIAFDQLDFIKEPQIQN